MEATIGSEAQLFYGVNSANFSGLSKRTLEWDPNKWKWDGDLFVATPINPDSSTPDYQRKQFPPLDNRISQAAPPSNSSSSFSDELSLGNEKDKRELETRKRVLVVDDDNLEAEAGSLTLNLGGHGYPTRAREPGTGEETSGKKAKMGGATSSRAACQVDSCGVDLSKAKDYHRRHKVCETHSKASKALVGNVMQRFCQQCSRFHALQEFDEGKRSCRRRLAGHNRRRRKTQPETAVNNNSTNDNQASGNLLMSLLRILSSIHSRRESGTNGEDLLSSLLRSLAGQGALHGDKNISEILQGGNGPSIANSKLESAMNSNGHQVSPSDEEQNTSVLADGMPQRISHAHHAIVEDPHPRPPQRPGTVIPSAVSSLTSREAANRPAARSKLNNFDLNDVYVDSDDGVEDAEQLAVTADLNAGSLGFPSWTQQGSHQSSPPQTSGTPDSASAQSPSSSSGEAQSRTDRIVFKLFGREPSDFPYVLRAQILDWLAHSPTDIESYIRPGCIILTLYLRLPEPKWEELSCDLSSSLSKLLDVSDDDIFWRTGWIYTRVHNRIAFTYNGRIVMDSSLSFTRKEHSTILTVRPIALPVSEKAQITVKGINLARTSTSFLCALEGEYLRLEADSEFDEHGDDAELDEVQCLKFSCTLPAVTGRGFIEVEDHGLSSSFFPFIVADKEICSELSSLESEIDYVQGEISKMESRNEALEFIHEMGWLLHRSNLRTRLNHLDPTVDLFPFRRFRWLMEFSVDHDWCAVICKLLDILLDGRVGGGDHPFLKYALSELGLLHRAVRKNSKSLVEVLLRYTPQRVAEELNLEYRSLVGGDGNCLFRPDCGGPGGLTPLHIAAGRDGSEDVLDALTDDPSEVGIEAWKSSRDSTGFTPEDYARLRGHYSYIHLVQRKINRRAPGEHVVVDIPVTSSESSINQKQDEGATTAFEIGGTQLSSMKRSCGLCDQKVAYGHSRRSLLYRPTMLSMVAIAAVCVCVALLFKSSPEVLYIFRPFRWEMLDYGTS